MKKALVAALTAATFLAPAGAFAQIGGESGDGRIVAAREALRKGDRSTLERLAAVLELAEEWTRANGVEQGGEQWAEAWSQLETLRGEAEGLDMDPRHALARAIGVLDRAAAVRR